MNTKHIILMLSFASACLFSFIAGAKTYTIVNKTDKPVEIIHIGNMESVDQFSHNRKYIDGWIEHGAFCTEGLKYKHEAAILKPGESRTTSYQSVKFSDYIPNAQGVWLGVGCYSDTWLEGFMRRLYLYNHIRAEIVSVYPRRTQAGETIYGTSFLKFIIVIPTITRVR